jgi:hypothetical protein
MSDTPATGLAKAPLFGALLRKSTFDGPAPIYLTVVLALVLWGVAIATWGLPALALVPLAFVPVIYALLILISVGK